MKDSKIFWNKQAKKFSESGNETSQKLVKRSKPYLSETCKLLDFACGTGQSTALYADLVSEAIGIDYSHEMIALASNKSKKNLHFLTGSLDHPSLTEGSFDVVTAFNVLHLMKNLDEVLIHIHRLLKPGGYFISYTPCKSEKSTLLVNLIILLGKMGFMPQVYPLTIEQLKNKMHSSGLTPLVTTTEGKGFANVFLVIQKEAIDYN